MSLFKFIFKNRSWRIGKASKFGKLEHKAGRVIAIPIVLGFVLQLSQHKISIWIRDNISGMETEYFEVSETIKWILVSLWIITFITWLTYLFSHTIEKKLYGHFGPRG